ncbi:hypothetical protein PCASD_14002 [Puccinia coronata f. sp. avenae]|uniref:Uncharacterized protein n=1 Tax=Puccinia coronata f. sp. avenae TaxID=200324 RepID=A0A2N5UCD8_9BASI|nr:hypothetical protein PCASD_14002 [Puccinia coronata f. sp. avenae]
MSLQINQKTATTSKSIEDGSIHKRPANKLKDPRDMFVGGHNHLMGDASDSNLGDSNSSSISSE